MTPCEYIPIQPCEFVGPSAKLADMLTRKATALKDGGTFKALLYGPPGTGKTQLANMFAKLVAGHKTQIESVNGRNVNLALIRRWQEVAQYLPLHGGFHVFIVNELDTVSKEAQDLLLTFFDEMGDRMAFIGTSNLNLSQLVERFQTRLQQFKVTAPDTSSIQALLAQWALPIAALNSIAVGCGGNVRAALLDAQSFLDAHC